MFSFSHDFEHFLNIRFAFIDYMNSACRVWGPEKTDNYITVLEQLRDVHTLKETTNVTPLPSNQNQVYGLWSTFCCLSLPFAAAQWPSRPVEVQQR